MSNKPEALRLADALETGDIHENAWQAAAELRRLHAENERLSATVKAREDEILTHSEAFYEATRLLSEEREKNERLAAALASSCDDGEALRLAVKLRKFPVIENWSDGDWVYIYGHEAGAEPLGNDPLAATRRAIVRAAIAAVKGEGA